MTHLPEMFGCRVFGDTAMRRRLSQADYRAFCDTLAFGRALTPAIADAVARAMRDWALEQGATHFTHWFQPMTGMTAEKHDSFLNLAPGGGVMMNFSGKELIRGESDASSFPSGGLRATFEARGYTAWDPTSPAFLKGNTLCIPTAFCSYGGEALDKKTPLMRSMEALERQALRVLRLFGCPARRVIPTMGAEQEYFLIDKAMFDARRDLRYAGRSLFGAKPPKGQEMEDHYFGAIGPRVAAFMKELDRELWELGIPAKTEHKEVAPGQYELAPVFAGVNLAADQNQLVMELLREVALRHGMVCLLHEKPFAGVNGSGKHNNWSLATDDGVNLLDPGESPHQNARFLLFLAAVVRAVDEHQGLLRASVASAGNDHRLGANEAPPAIVSIFLGDQLTEIIEALAGERPYHARPAEDLAIGVDALPRFPRDLTDRNRTSAMAFTGNKFEFRMPGSSFSISGPCAILNTIVADSLKGFADALEGAPDFQPALAALLRDTFRRHLRIVFNGDGYSSEWPAEAARRGLLNLRATPDALPCLIEEKSVALLSRQGVLSPAEVRSRYEILLEGYNKTLFIEAGAMLDIARRSILPAVLTGIRRLTETALAKRQIAPDLPCEPESALLGALSAGAAELHRRILSLDGALAQARAIEHAEACAAFGRDELLSQMRALRAVADELEQTTDAELWPLPTYGEILFSI